MAQHQAVGQIAHPDVLSTLAPQTQCRCGIVEIGKSVPDQFEIATNALQGNSLIEQRDDRTQHDEIAKSVAIVLGPRSQRLDQLRPLPIP